MRNSCSGYDIGELLSYKGIAEGVENSNFLLHTTSGYFILTLYEKRVAKNDLPFFLALMAHLAVHGITCPQPVKNRRGEALAMLAGRPAAIITFLEGIWPRKPNAAHCAGVGQVLAKMHLAGRDFPMSRANALSVSGWRPLFDAAASRADELQHGLRDFIAAELDHLESGIWPQQLPDGVIHADLFPDNVFFLGDKLSGVIDFTFACNDILAYDIAICSTPGVSRPITPSTSPRRARFSTPMAASANSPTPSRTRCRCWRAAPRCGFC